MNSYGVRQFDKVQLRAIAIGKQYDKKAPSALAISDDMNLDRDLYVERDTHIVRNLFVGKGSGSESIGRVNVVGELSVSGNTFLGTSVQTTTVRNDIIVEDTLSVAGSVTVASCQNELPSNFMEFTRTRHPNDDNIHVAIQEGDSLGSILFKGSDGTDWKKYVDIQTIATSTQLDNEGGKIVFKVISGGGAHSGDDGTNNIAGYNTLFSIGGENSSNSQNNEVLINEAGINTDFRVKTDQKDHMLFVDSLANKIGIDLPNPQFTLDIQGDINISNRSYVSGTEYKGGQVKRDSVTDNIESVNFIEGKLGIGTLNPDYDVDITGTLNVRNKIITKDLVVKGSTSFLPDTNINDPSTASHALILTGTTYTDDVTTALNRTQFSIENTSGQSINVGVLTNGKSMIQVVDDDTVPNFNSLSIQPLGGKIAIGKENPNVILDIGGNDSIKIPIGNTAQRPTANSINELGYIRYNTELKRFEGYGQNHNQASATNEWISLSGLKDTDNDTYITVEDQNNSDNDQIKFFVEGRQELTLDKSGYLGIGVTSPSARLHIESNDANYNSEPLAIFKSQNKDASIRVEGKGETYIEIANIDTTGDTNNSWGIGMNDDKNLYFNWKTNGTINYDTNINERNAMTIMQNGNVGINKATPNVTFDIEGEDAIRIPRGTTAQRPTSLGLGQIRYNTQLHTFEGYGAGNAWGSLGGIKDVDRDTYITAENSAGEDNDELRFYTAQFEENVTNTTVPRMIIKNDGDIGINTISPNYKLDINGTLGVNDSVNMNSTLDVAGVTNINNNLGVTGNTVIDGTTNISGATTIDSTLNVTGNLTFDSSINRVTFKDKTYIEGKDSDYLKIITNNQERLRINPDGNVGIGKSDPDNKLDINGSLRASGATTLQSTLDVTAATNLNSTLGVVGATVLNNTLDVAGATTLTDTLQVSQATTLNSTLSVSGVSQFSSDLTTIGKISARHTTQNVGVEITPFGGNSATNGGGRVFFRETDNSNNYGFSLGFNGGDGLNPSNLAWPSNTFCISRHNGNSSGEVVLAIDRTSNNVGLGAEIPTSNLHIKQTSGDNDCMIKIEADGGNNSNKPNTGIEFLTNDGNPSTPNSGEPTYTSSKILSGWDQGDGDWDESFFKIQTHHVDSTLNDSFTIRGPNVGINNNDPQFTLDINGTVNTTGATTFKSTLNVTGSTTLENSLGVTGATTLGNTLGVTGSATLGNTLAVTGSTTLNNTLDVTGAATLNSTLGVTGSATFDDTMTISGDTTIASKLGIGTTSPSDILTISSNSNNRVRIEKLTSGGQNEIDFRALGSNGNTWSSAKIVAFDNREQGGGGYWHSKLGLFTSEHGVSSENMTINYEGNIGIKNTSPNVTLDIIGNDAIRIPTGTTVQRPTTQELGQIRYNTELDTYEGYGAGNAWGSLGGVKDVDRDTFISAQNNANADNDELKFFTAQSEDTITDTTVPRMIIKNDGKIGLNNISPSHLLHVNGTSRLGDSGSYGAATYFGTGNFYIHHGSSGSYNGNFSGIQAIDKNVVVESNQNIFVKSSLNNIIGNTIIGTKDTTTDQLHVEGSTNITGATNLESTLDVSGQTTINNSVGINTSPGLVCSLDIASVSNTQHNVMRLQQPSTSHNSQIRFSRLDGNGNDYGPEILYDSNQSFSYTVDSLNLIATGGQLGMNITWNGKVGIGGVNNSGENLLVNGTFKASSNSNIGGTLDVTGATTLSSLDVTGATQSGSIDVTGTTSLGDTLDVTGATTINNTLSVGDSLFIESNSSSEPIATFKTNGVNTDCSIRVESKGESYIEFANTHSSTGDSAKSWGIGTNDDRNLHFNYKTNGTINDAANDAMTILSDGKVGIGNNNPSHTLDVDGTVNIEGDCFIGGDLQFAGEVEMSNSLAITGDSNFDGDLTISGHGDFNGNLDVALATTLNSTLSVTGITTLKNDLNIYNNNTNKFSVDSSTGNVSAQGTLNVLGSTTLSDTLGVTGATTLSDTLAVTGNTTVGGKLGIGTTSPSQILTVSSNSNNTIRIEKLTSGGQNQIDFRALGDNYNSTWSAAKIVAYDTRAQGAGGSWHSKLGFFTSNHGNSTEKMIIDYLGNVGIGIEPTSKLHIKGSVNSSHFYQGSDEDVYIRGGKDSGDIFLNGDTSGKVGIGNNNPQYKLDITGTMRTTGATTLSDTLGVIGATTLGSTLDVTGAATLTDSLTLGTAPAPGANSQTTRLLINSRTNNTADFHVYDRKATLGNIEIVDNIIKDETNNHSATYSKAIITNTKTNPYSGIHLYNRGNIMITAMKENYQYWEDITAFSNNFIWYTGANTGSTSNGPNPIERMKLLENGNLGIGTTSPNAKLHVKGTGSSEPLALFNTTSGDSSVRIEGYGESYLEIANKNVSSTNTWGIGTNDSSNLEFNWKPNGSMNDGLGGNTDGISDAPPLCIKIDGNVGIGTKSPSNKLHVDGTFKSTGVGTFDSNLDIGGTLDVTGATTLSQSLTTNGNFNVNNKFNVVSSSGNTTISGTTNSQGKLTAGLATGTSLQVEGESLLKKKLTVNLASGLGLDVKSNANIDGTLQVDGATTIGSTLNVSGDSNFGGYVVGNLRQKGAQTDNYIEYYYGNTRQAWVGYSGNSNFNITNQLGSTVNVNNNLIVTGTTTLQDTLTVSENTTLSKDLTVSGDSTITGDLTVNGSELRVNGNLFVSGTTTTINTTNMTIQDKDIILASNATNNAAADGAGFIIEAGSNTDKKFTYSSTGDKFTTNIPLQIEDALIYGNSSEYAYFKKNSGTGFLKMWEEIYLNSPNSDIYFQTGGANRMFIKNSGNVGIGTTSPSSKFHVKGTGSAEPLALFQSELDCSVRIEGSGESYLEIVNKNASTTNSWGIGTNDSSNLEFNWKPNGGMNGGVGGDTNGVSNSPPLCINTAGKVGIGTNNPSQALHVAGSIRVTNQLICNTEDEDKILLNGTTSGSKISLGAQGRDIQYCAGTSSGTGGHLFKVKNSSNNWEEKMRITYVGKVGIAQTSPTELLDISKQNADNYLRIRSGDASTKKGGIKLTEYDNEYGFRVYYDASTDKLNIASQIADGTPTDKITVTHNGNVGIGTTSPSYKLDVNGTLRVQGGTSYNNLQGHLSVGNNLNNAHFRFGSATSSSNGSSPIALLRSSDANNPKLIINYGSQFPAGTEIDSDTKIDGNLEVTGSLIGSAFDSLAGSLFNNIHESGSNVGIGTEVPSSNLHIKQTSGSNDCLIKIEADGGSGSNKPNTGIEFITNDGSPHNPTSSELVYTSSKILSGWNINESDWNQSFFKIQTHHTDSSTLNDSFTIKGQNVGINNNSPQNTLDVDGTFKASGAATLTDSLTLGTAPASDGNSQATRLLINSRTSNTASFDVYDRKATLGNLDIADNIVQNETNNDTATYSRTILTNTKTNGYSGIHLFNKGNIMITAMKKDWQYFEDMTFYSNNFIWYTGENTGSTANGSNPIERMKLLENGNLGIGTQAPDKKLHVKHGSIEIEENSGDLATGPIPELVLRQSKYAYNHTANRGVGTIKFVNSQNIPSNTYNSYASIEGIVRHERYNETHCPDLGFFVKNYYNGTLLEAMTIVGGNSGTNTEYGNIGIGTNSPEYKLDVRGNMRLGDGSTAQQALRFRTSDGDWLIGSNNEGNGTDFNHLFFYNADDSKTHMCIQRGTGNIGIGGIKDPIKSLDLGNTGGDIRMGGIANHDNAATNSIGHMWSNGGGLYGGIKFISNGNDDELGFWTHSSGNNSGERMRINGLGNVGIGTNSPSDLLHLKSAGDVVLRMEADSDNVGEGDNPLIHMSQDNNLVNLKIGLNGSTNGSGITGSKDNYAFINTHTDTSAYGLQLATENKVAMTINELQNIGIGTTEPSSKLHIFDNSVGNSSTLILERKVSTFGGSDDGCAIELKAKYDNPGHPAHNISYRQTRIRAIDDEGSLGSNSGGIAFDTQYHSTNNTDYVERMRIKGNGNVGIGTTNPVSKLQVENGDIRVREGKIILSEVRYNFSPTGRVAITGAPIENEINGNGGPSTNSPGTDGDAVGFLRLSAGGSSGSKSYIDLYGWESKRITFGTEGSEKMCLNNQGRLGIGVLEPTHKLDVNGTCKISGATEIDNNDLRVKGTQPIFQVYRNSYDSNSMDSIGGTITLGNEDFTEAKIHSITKSIPNNTYHGVLCLSTRSHTVMKEAIYIGSPTYKGTGPYTNENYNGGFVGIGTTSPSERLHVNGNTKIDGNLELTGNLTVSGSSVGGGSSLNNIHESGSNVGIGTTSPQQALEVHGNILLGENNVQSFIHGGTDTVLSSDSGLRFIGDSNDTDGSAANEIVFGFGSAVNTDSPRNFSFSSAFGSNGLPRNEAMRIKGSNLFVGIGTTEPDYKLDVRGNMRLGDGSTAQQALRFRTNDGDWLIGSNNEGNGTNDNQLFVYNVDDSKIHMCIQRGSGNVGIGTQSPTSKLCIQSTGYTNITTNQHDTQLSIENSTINNGDNASMGIGVMDNGKGTIQVKQKNNGSGYRDLLLQPIAGNVGIGTDTPSQSLHVAGSIRVTNQLICNTEDEDKILLNGTTSSSKISLGAQGRDIEYCAGTTSGTGGHLFKVKNSSNEFEEKMRITYTGKVGIGNTDPQHKLDITGELRIGDSNASEQGLHLLTNHGNWEVGTNQGGNGTNNNQFYIYDNSNSGADYAVTVQRGTGDVGIGTKSPSKKLDVNGDTNINGELLVSDRVNAKNTIKTYTVDFSSVPNNKFAAVVISLGRLDFLEYYHEFFVSSGGTSAGGYPNSNFIKVQASGGGYNDSGAHANVEYGLYNQGEWVMLAIYATVDDDANQVIVYLRGGHSSGGAQNSSWIHGEAGKYSIHTMSGSVTGYATDSLSYPILDEQFAHNYTNGSGEGEMGSSHYIRGNHRLYNAREYFNSSGTGIRPNRQFAVPHDSSPYKSSLFDFEGSLRTRVGGILLQNNDGNFNPGHRKTVGTSVISNEIHGVGGGTDSHDVGFLRLSAGGGSGIQNKSYIDLYGYNSNIITLGTAGTERMCIDSSGKVGIGTDAPSDLLHLKSAGDVVLRMEADSDNSGESDNPLIHMSQDGNGVNLKIGLNGSNNGSGITGSKDNYAFINSHTTGGTYGIQLATENKVAMTIDDGQNLGIGTNSPSSKLHVEGTGSSEPLALFNTTSGDSSVRIEGSGESYLEIANKNVSSTNSWGIGTNDSSNLEFNWKPNGSMNDGLGGNTNGISDAPPLCITIDGDVGIGTKSPFAGVHITKTYTDYAANATGMAAQDTAARSTSWVDKRKAIPRLIVGRENAQNSTTKSADTTIASIDLFNHVDKLATITGVVHAGQHMPSIVFNTKPTYVGNDDYIERMVIRENGNVGIGTTSPVGKLDVRGQISCQNGINIDPGNNNILINTSRHIAYQDNWTPVQITYSHQGNYGGNLFFNTHGNDGNNDNNVSTKMSIMHNGNVGIGTDTPSNKLHVAGSIRVTNQLICNTEDEDKILLNGTTSSSKISLGAQGRDIEYCAGTTSGTGGHLFKVKNSSNEFEEKMRITYTGKVGIGTTSPDYKLDVRGNMRLGDGSTAQQALRFRTSDGDWQIGSNNYGNGTNDNQLFFYNVDDGQVRMCIQRGTGNIGIGTQAPTSKLQLNSGGFTLLNNDGNFSSSYRKAISSSVIENEIHGQGGGAAGYDVGFLRLSAGGGTNTHQKSYIDLYGHASNRITFGTGGSERMVIEQSGNVGIGTEDPSGLLHMKSTGNVVLRMEADSDNSNESDNPVIHMSQDNNQCNLKIGMNGSTDGSGMTGSKDNYAYINTNTDTQNYGLHLATENKVAMTIDERQFVGIGTNNPGSLLHLRGSNPTLRIERDTYIGSEESIISFRNSAFDEAQIKSSTPNTDTGNVYRGHLSFFTRNHTGGQPGMVRAMHITDPSSTSVGGKVGINTNSPARQLDVKGECRVEQLSNSTSFFEGHESGGGRFGFSFGLVGGSSDKNVHIDMQDNITNTYRAVGFFENSSGSVGGNSNNVINDFTGQHRCISFNNISADHYGLIVFSTGNYLNTDNTINPTINDSLPICKLADTNNDQRVLGVISNSKDDNDDRVIGYGLLKTIQQKANKNETRIHINSVGEGGIWVCNKNGNISNGDYITTCSIPGYGAKQSDNILYNYSVAKITCDCNFKINRQTKMRVKVRNVVTTKQVPETTTKEKTTTEFKIEYNEELQKHIRREIVKTVSEEVNVMEEVDLYDEQGNLIYDEEGNTIKHSVQKMKTIEENRTELVYDENGNIQYEKDITEDGEEQFEFEYDTRFLLPDGRLIPNKEEYITRLNNGEEVYIACFVGCSYHCG